jgi:N-acetylneuraminate synthase
MRHPYIEIANRKIGYNYEPLVIAEIGINHGGSLEVAKNMAKAAFDSGVEFVKHQTHIVDDEMSLAAKKTVPGNSDDSIYDIMSRCSLSEQDELELKLYIEKLGMTFISTPFGREAANRLNSWEVPAFKIGSGECNNYPLLDHICSFKKPIILSTGMNTIDSVAKAVKIFEKHSIQYALLHTTNLYPTPNSLVRLGSLNQLNTHFPNCPYGLSDHTTTNHACYGAVALGASILERHFTDSMERIGPDIVCSMDPKATTELIEGSKIIYKQRGGGKTYIKEEQVTIDFAYSTICSIKNIDKGEVFTKDNIWVKRPGKGGIRAEFYYDILGKKSKRNIKADSQIKQDDII